MGVPLTRAGEGCCYLPAGQEPKEQVKKGTPEAGSKAPYLPVSLQHLLLIKVNVMSAGKGEIVMGLAASITHRAVKGEFEAERQCVTTGIFSLKRSGSEDLYCLHQLLSPSWLVLLL